MPVLCNHYWLCGVFVGPRFVPVETEISRQFSTGDLKETNRDA